MDFRPLSDRAIRQSGAEDGSSRSLPIERAGHDFDAPAWRRRDAAGHHPDCRPPAPRLIDLERRARFSRLALDLR
jgi:hypothetical protein